MKQVIERIKSVIKEISILNILIIFFAGIINAIGVTMFLAPVNLYDSGISGELSEVIRITRYIS